MFLIKLLVNSKLVRVKFFGSLKLYTDFGLHEVGVPNPTLFKSQLYTFFVCIYLVVEFGGHKVCTRSASEDTVKQFSR